MSHLFQNNISVILRVDPRREVLIIWELFFTGIHYQHHVEQFS